jgi:putative addiction module component (TIGR02574 family)
VTAEAKKIFQQALALPEPERAALIDALADSIVGADDDDLSPEWKAEIARRIEAVERGDSRLIPGDEVEARIRETLGRV